jgi:hypothetical protein
MARKQKMDKYAFGNNHALNTASCAGEWLRNKESSTLELAQIAPGVTALGFKTAITILEEWSRLGDPLATAFDAADYLIENRWHLMCATEALETPQI